MSTTPPLSTSSSNNNNNDLILKLIFPPTSSIIAKTILAKPSQKASEIVLFASQLAGLQPGYSLYIAHSKLTQRSQWIDDESTLASCGITSSDQVLIKRRPGFRTRKNTFAQLKGFKEGKVQKLSTFGMIWNPRYLRLYSQRLVHSPSETDPNTEFVTFADIVNVDRDVTRKYSFVVVSRGQQPGKPTVGAGDDRELIFRCTNQSEMEEWVSSIRTMLKKSRPDLFLPPLSIPYNVTASNAPASGANTPASGSTTVSTTTSPALIPSITTSNIDTHIDLNNSGSSSGSSGGGLSSSQLAPVTPDKLQTKGRSFSFSLSAMKKKQHRESPPEMSPVKLNTSVNFEDELRKMRNVLDKETKQKIELEKKYRKLKQKYSTYKKNNKPESIFTRSRSFSTSAAPPPFASSTNLLSQSLNNSSSAVPNSEPIAFSTPSKSIPSSLTTSNIAGHMGSWTPGTSPYTIGANRAGIRHSVGSHSSGMMTEPDSTETETFSVLDDDDEESEMLSKRDEIKELRDQLLRVREKMQLEMQRREESELERQTSDRELFKRRKMEERRERELANERDRENDQLEAMSEITERLKDSLLKLKSKLEEQEQMAQDEEERLSESYDGDASFISDISMEQVEEAY